MATSYAEVKKLIQAELEDKYTLAEINQVLNAFIDVATALVTTYGEKVTIPKFVSLKPAYVAAKRKGEMVRNPGTGEMQPRAEGKPASFKVRATASPYLKTQFPSVSTKQGKKLEADLRS